MMSSMFPSILEKVIKSSLNALLGSEELATQLFARKSVDCIAARLDIIIPEIYPDENLQRAVTLAGGSASEVLSEMLKIIIYVTSNHLFDSYSETYYDDICAIICLCRLSGLADWPMIRDLVRLSRSSSTLAGTVDMLFEASVISEAVDMMEHFLRADDAYIHKTECISHVPRHPKCLQRLGMQISLDSAVAPLAAAIHYHSIELVTVLLKYGASTNQIVYANVGECPNDMRIRMPLLSFAILGKLADDSGAIVRLLLERGAPVNLGSGLNEDFYRYGSRELSPLQAAFMMSDLAIIRRLLDLGARLDQLYISSPVLVFHVPNNGEKSRFKSRMVLIKTLKSISCLGLAASFCTQTIPSANDAEDKSSDEESAVELCREIFDKIRFVDTNSHSITTDAFILAAGLGYTKVLSFLYGKIPTDCNAINRFFSALDAAACYAEAQTVQFLFDMASSQKANSKPRQQHSRYGLTTKSDWLEIYDVSPLHIASFRGLCDMSTVLIQKGVDINERCELSDIERDLKLTYGGSQTSCLSALGIAIYFHRWDVACLLVSSGATATTQDLCAAIDGPCVALVKQLVETGLCLDKEKSNAYEFALLRGEGDIAIYLHSIGVKSPGGSLAAVFRAIESPRQIQEMLPQNLLRSPAAINADSSGRSYLENAILSGRQDIITFAFSLDRTAYDSGSMCAAIYLAMHSSLPDEEAVLDQLLLRRHEHAFPSMDPILENTAISLALWCQRPRLVTRLIEHDRGRFLSQHLASVCASDANFQYRGDATKTLALEWRGVCYPNGRPDDDTQRVRDNWHDKTLLASPLLFAVVVHRFFGGIEAAIESLLEAGYQADVITLQAALEAGWPFFSAQQLPFNMFKRLAQTCKDVNDIDQNGCKDNPLYLAVSNNDLESARVLIELGAEVTVSCRPQHSCLAKAALLGNLPMARLLLDHGTNIGILSNTMLSTNWWEYTTPLASAAAKGHIGLVRYLISRGADLNARRLRWSGSRLHETALEAAAGSGRLDMVQFLLASGARTENHGSVQYVRAIERANNYGHSAVVALLRSQRRWTKEDQDIDDAYCGEINSASANTLFYDAKEFNLAEMIDALTELDDYDPHPQSWIQHSAVVQPCQWKIEVAIAVKQSVNDISVFSPHTKQNLLRFVVRFATKFIRLHGTIDGAVFCHTKSVMPRALQKWVHSLQVENKRLDINDMEAETMQDSTVQGWPWDDGIAGSFLTMNPKEFDDDGFHPHFAYLDSLVSDVVESNTDDVSSFREGRITCSDDDEPYGEIVSSPGVEECESDHGVACRSGSNMIEASQSTSATERRLLPGPDNMSNGENLINTSCEVYDENNLEQQRITAFRNEMEGGVEAPFIPMEWSW